MKRFFNPTFFKFVSGFIGMIALGLIGIALASYFGADDYMESTNGKEIKAHAEQE